MDFEKLVSNGWPILCSLVSSVFVYGKLTEKVSKLESEISTHVTQDVFNASVEPIKERVREASDDIKKILIILTDRKNT